MFLLRQDMGKIIKFIPPYRICMRSGVFEISVPYFSEKSRPHNSNIPGMGVPIL